MSYSFLLAYSCLTPVESKLLLKKVIIVCLVTRKTSVLAPRTSDGSSSINVE